MKNHITDNSQISPELLNKIKKIKHVALDMDGTIYNGTTLFPFTISFLNKLKELGISYSFLTNNPSKSIEDYLKKLENLGISATEEEMYSSAVATIDYLKNNYPEAKRLFILGTPSMIKQFEKAGYISTEDSAEDIPDALVVAFDMTLTYERLCRASWWAKQNILYVATNPDRVCPTDQPVVLVDCASIYSCIETATGRKPDIVLGKPQKEMLDGILTSKKLKPEEVAMVGDRIYTDMMMAHNAGAFGVLVLTGEATLDDAKKADPELDIILPSIETLGNLIEYSHLK
ncbi:HAD-IIA family hydrolase [Apibacter adventoris]|uniref:Hydrolase n=1 Tax=Apibacter adventoris TaxID=1679466 RepID=A0A2S8AES2_9FLAO|nr:HAD-IIA family hydrolase [Apibacter adventoris]PQL94115.1 hydrolase [Apibacter adventoris]PQL94376.1 hydrolase [Apibacter adventoris]